MKKFFGSAFIAVGIFLFLLCVGLIYNYGPHSNLVAAVIEDCEQRIARGDFSGSADRALFRCTDDLESPVGMEYEFAEYAGVLSGLASIVLVLWGARLWQRDHKFTGKKNFFRGTSTALVGGLVVLMVVVRAVAGL